MNTKIYSGFPGVGKTRCYNKYKDSIKILDSDSSQFDKSNFPGNYIKHIKENIGKVDIILVSSHKEVRDALTSEGIEYTLVLPRKLSRAAYQANYLVRDPGNPQFAYMIDKHWVEWIDDCKKQEGCDIYTLDTGEYLSSLVYRYLKAQPHIGMTKEDKQTILERIEDDSLEYILYYYSDFSEYNDSKFNELRDNFIKAKEEILKYLRI